MLLIGGRDMEAGAVSVRLHHGGPQGAKPKGEVVADILASIKDAKGVNSSSNATRDHDVGWCPADFLSRPSVIGCANQRDCG